MNTIRISPLTLDHRRELRNLQSLQRAMTRHPRPYVVGFCDLSFKCREFELSYVDQGPDQFILISWVSLANEFEEASK